MATHVLELPLPQSQSPGDVYPSVSSISLSNDLYEYPVLTFTDTSTRDQADGSFKVPNNYVGTPLIRVEWFANATTGTVVWDFDYRAVGDGESMDPSADQESVTANEDVTAAAFEKVVTDLTLTAGNLAAGDEVLYSLFRDGADATDDLAASAHVSKLSFVYDDA